MIDENFEFQQRTIKGRAIPQGKRIETMVNGDFGDST